MKNTLKMLAYISLFMLIVGSIAYLKRYDLTQKLLELPAYEYTDIKVTTIKVPMRDGIELQTSVFKPEGQGPWPTVLIRDPYAFNQFYCQLLARYGYACVHQDVRGRHGSSDSDWYPVIHERNDGLDTLDWLVQQPWQNDNIATYGSSYVGLAQWAMIDEMPKQVKTVIADISHGDWYEIVNKNGHFTQGVMSDWALMLHNSEATLEGIAAHRPAIQSNASFLNGKKQWFHDYLTHETKTGEYWSAEHYTAVRNAHKEAAMPVLMTGAWHDFFLDGQLDVFKELPRHDESLLIIRNGYHMQDSWSGYKNLAHISITTSVRWLDRHLKGKNNAELPITGYLLQDNVNNEYQHKDVWPRQNAVKHFYLGGLAKAVNCDGGSLLVNKAVTSESVSYSYDPHSPVPSRGGANNFSEGVVNQGSDLCARSDVLSFESTEIPQELTISGSIEIAINVASDAQDSAFTVKLQEKLADGRILNIRDDITSLSFRNGALSRQNYEANSAVDVVFNLTPIKWTLQAGSTLRLDISSSNYPFYNAHPNVTENWSTLEKNPSANQTLFSGHLNIPIYNSEY